VFGGIRFYSENLEKGKICRKFLPNYKSIPNTAIFDLIKEECISQAKFNILKLRAFSDAQKEKYLIPGIEGKIIGALGLTEPDAGSDARSIRATAVKKGDKYIINGTKTWITNGTMCDYVIVARLLYEAKSVPLLQNADSKRNQALQLHQSGTQWKELQGLFLSCAFVSRFCGLRFQRQRSSMRPRLLARKRVMCEFGIPMMQYATSCKN